MFRGTAQAGRKAAFFGLFVLFWLVLIRLPMRDFSLDGDTSWQGALSYFAFKKLQFGKDVIFTYGPLGYITTDTYWGYLLASRVGFELLLKGVFALLMAVQALRLRPVLRSCFIVNIAFFSPTSLDAVYLFAIVLSACYVIESRLSSLLTLGMAVLFAVISLTKFTFSLLCVASLLTVTGYALTKRKWLRATGLVATYLVCVCSLWCLNGQRPSGVLPLLRGACEVASGYAEAMSMNPPWSWFWISLGALLLGGSLLIGLACASKEKDRDLAILLVLGAGLFLAWKEGVVRADPPHLYALFAYVLFVVPAAWAVFRPPARHRRLLLGMTLIALVSPYVLLFLFRPEALPASLSATSAGIIQNVTAFVHPSDFRATLDGALSRMKQENALPGMKRLIGQESVDVFGHEQAIALLNDLNYQPRPVFQGYSAYTPFLVARNRDFYLGPTAPSFVIFKYQTVDDRLAAEDDAGALEVILRNYEPVGTEKKYLLWKRKAVSSPPAPHRLLREGTATWGDPLPLLSDQYPLWIEVEIGSTWLGKLREFLYRPTVIAMTVETVHHDTEYYRLVRRLARSGFMVNPALRNLNDLTEMYRAPGNRNVSSITISVADSARPLYRTGYRYRLYAGDEWPPSRTGGGFGIDLTPFRDQH
jgi:hypothetical protein